METKELRILDDDVLVLLPIPLLRQGIQIKAKSVSFSSNSRWLQLAFWIPLFELHKSGFHLAQQRMEDRFVLNTVHVDRLETEACRWWERECFCNLHGQIHDTTLIPTLDGLLQRGQQ